MDAFPQQVIDHITGSSVQWEIACSGHFVNVCGAGPLPLCSDPGQVT